MWFGRLPQKEVSEFFHVSQCPSEQGKRWQRVAFVLLLACLLFQTKVDAQVRQTRLVLLLTDLGTPASPGFTEIESGVFNGLQESPYSIEFYSDSLEVTMFPDEEAQLLAGEEFLRKYSGRKPDVIVAVGPASLKFMAGAHDRFFPDTPVVFCGITQDPRKLLKLDPHFTGVKSEPKPEETLNAALHLLPQTKRVAVVGGMGKFDRQWEAIAKEGFLNYETKLDFMYLTDLAMPKLLEQLKQLPSQTVVFHTSITQDAAGEHFIDSAQSVPLVIGAANAPVFVMDDVDFRAGAVGGDLVNWANNGRIAADMAVRILNGEKAQNIPIATSQDVYTFDWIAMQRWGLKERNLPPGSIVVNRPASFWYLYKRYVLAGIFVILAQMLAIFALLWQRAERRKTQLALVHANEQLRLAVEAGKCVAWDLDIKSGRTRWFGDLRTMFGMNSETFVGHAEDFYRYIHPEDRERVLDALFKSRQRHEPYYAEFRLLLPDGTIRWVDDRGEHEYAKNGEPERTAGMAVDTTERKQADEALKKSEEKFSKAFRESPVAFSITSTNDHRYIEVNETFERMTGRSRAEIVGRSALDVGIWADDNNRIEFIKRLLAEGSLRDLETSYRAKNGEVRTGLTSAELIEINGEQCSLAAVVDITEAKKSEEARQASERRFSQFFSSLPEYCYMTSPAGKLLDVNPAACEALGYTKEELLGKTLSGLYAPESALKLVHLLEKWKKTGALHNEEMVILTKGGKRRAVLLNAANVKDAQGKTIYVASVQTDITERKEILQKLRESQDYLKGIIESVMDGIIAVDEEQRIVVFNAAAEKMFACRAHDAIGTSIDRFIPPRFRERHQADIRRFGDTDTTARIMGGLWALRNTGEEFPMEASISQVQARGKKLFTVIVRDVSERKQAEEARFRHAAIIESSSDAIISLDLNLVITSWNIAAQQMYGYSEAEALRQPIFMIIPPGLREKEGRLLEDVLVGHSVEHYETDRITKDGRRIYVQLSISSIRDWAGKIVGVSKIARDITLNKQAEMALRESEERFRHVANAAPVMIWMSGPDKLCTYFNQPWLNFTGRPLHAELGDGWGEGVHPDDLEGCLKTYGNAFDQREPFEMEYRLLRHDGVYRWVFDRGVPRFNADGSFTGYIGSCLDVTDRRLAEEALSDMSRKLIEAQEQERTRIARELHDDINQRVALVSVNLERLQRDLSSSTPATGQRFDELRDQLSDLGRDIQALSHHLHSSKLEYLGLVTAATSFCKELSEEHGVQVEFHSENIPKHLPWEMALCFYRVLQESLQNALKHSGSKHFEVWLNATPNEIELNVRDSGVGFDPEEALRGRGLGLTSMKERLKLVHGDLIIDAQPGCGTVVRATAPFSPATKAAGA